ncbi:MAG: GNAT family N-acetyltransferase [Candidatus Abyssobacteria bacterium SURF_17]|uniref:GNAT family N-acetyltransferase n=1 Tax=Candidatus Abyssobacteria bacterium SURF_17 TaxID=2093361 RepID=A0A419EUU3_9BACT|nr:MAG: GNAT family N-acetyltransferase [Candidatus Abyssubacteria bacterium SURF_17]
MEILIRPARLDDAEHIARILNQVIESGAYTVLDTLFTVDDERTFITNFPEHGVFHVAECSRSRAIHGFQTIEPFSALPTKAFHHVASIGTFIDMEHRRRGIGARLSETTFEAAKRKGYEKIFTYVRSDNRASLAFHLKLGFRIIGIAERQAKLRGGYVDEVLIEKFL